MAHITIYTRDFCGYCARALQVLKQKDANFTEINAGADLEQRKIMMDRSGRSTFPQIFVGDRHIGGCDDLLSLDRQGKLDELLQA